MSDIFNNYDLLVNTMSIQTTSYETDRMEKYIKKFLNKHKIDWSTDGLGNIYAIKGNADRYPTMVCHIDTVHDINLNSVVKRHRNILYSIDTTNMERTGIGGDDKVGVYITLQMLLNFNNFKAAFFVDEEVGCVGSRAADFNFFNDSTIVLECDRQGMGDFVTSIGGTQLSNKELQNDIKCIVEDYNRSFCTGGMTDVQIIAQNHDVQTANINCGYYQPHTDDEFIIIDDVFETARFCYHIFKATKHKMYRMTRPKIASYAWGQSYYPYSYGMPSKKKSITENTAQPIDIYDDYPVDTYNNTTLYSDWVDVHDTAETCNNCNIDSHVYDDYTEQYYCYQCDAYIDNKKKLQNG